MTEATNQCTAATAAGSRCKRPAMESGMCWTHGEAARKSGDASPHADPEKPVAGTQEPPGGIYDALPDGVKVYPYCLVTGTRTDVPGLERFIIRGDVPGCPWAMDNLTEGASLSGVIEWQQSGHAASRPSDIYLCWKVTSVSFEKAVTDGYWHQSKTGPRASDPPHFGIARDGTVVQFLDPSMNGCGRAKSVGLKGTETIVIENLNKAHSQRASRAQIETAQKLITMLKWIYAMPNRAVLEDQQWRVRD